jgi:DNA-directed RNA polymerase specialized sigma24 family protein
MRVAIARLDEPCPSLLLALYYEGTPVDELARQRQERKNTIEVQLTRCREKLYPAVLEAWLPREDPNRRGRIDAMAMELPGQPGAVFRAWRLERKSVREIARALGAAEDTVRSWLVEAKQELYRRVSGGEAA